MMRARTPRVTGGPGAAATDSGWGMTSARSARATSPPSAASAAATAANRLSMTARLGCVRAADPGLRHPQLVVEQHEIGVAADGDTADFVVEAEELGRVAAGHARSFGEIGRASCRE